MSGAPRTFDLGWLFKAMEYDRAELELWREITLAEHPSYPNRPAHRSMIVTRITRQQK